MNPDISSIPTEVLVAEIRERTKITRHEDLLKDIPVEIRYDNAVLDLDREVFLVQPSVHGGGGWCGSTTLTKGPLRDLLCLDPEFEYGYCDSYFGDDRYRICIDENPSHRIAIYNEYKWQY